MKKFLEKNFRTPIKLYRNLKEKTVEYIIKKQKYGIYSIRVKETISCRDTDYIPKVDNAGGIFQENHYTYQLMHNGVKIAQDCYVGGWMTEIIKKLKGHHEPQEEKVFYEILKYIPNDASMMELGSYWSYYSLWFAKKVKNAKNYMVEPMKNNMEIGYKNFELNNCKGEFLNAYLGSEYKQDSLFEDWDGNKYSLPMVSIDYLINKKYSIPYLNILHSDIQGGELEMLKGCKESISQNKIGFLIISTHGDDIHKECLNLIQSDYKFKIIVEHKPSESYSVDGLVAAVAPHITEYPEKIEISKK